MMNIIHIIAWTLLAIWFIGSVVFAFFGNRHIKSTGNAFPFMVHWISIISVSLRWPVILYFAATSSDTDVVE